MPQTLTCQKELFSLPDDITYLNGAYMSPLLKSAEEAGIKGIQLKRAPNDITLHHFFDQIQNLRKSCAQLLNASNPNNIVMIPAVSYGMGIVAKNLDIKKGENIVIAGEQFPSNVYTWMSLAKEKNAELVIVSPPTTTENRGKRWNESILEAINSKTKLVAISHTHWADGTLFNLKAIREATNKYDALMVVDGTQSVGALPFDISDIQPDALVCSGYKWMLGPYGSGIGYFNEKFANGTPLEEAWINRYESENFANLVNYQDEYQPDTLRFESGGRSNFINAPIFQAAIDTILNWGVDNIQTYLFELIDKPIDKLKEIGCIIENKNYFSPHLFGIRLTKAFDMDKLKRILNEEKIYVSFRGTAMRVSPHVYNEEADLEKLISAIEKSKK
ncbi:aminotransferase class V-fold PLP-dependent enzyme [Chondrinema litorale]|uniref:aminotransferase class V-fold PLP-dependent enzyme n=1 Tax=Chondrinema litorale TaxID=2994555 RepID=UPI002543ED3B|nr:aminotransferase class V-fold PLP-dependent enzyme [Chondrinema litorale]UZR92309.1 aminotransferase class V-fold PLP-dependent enzyme [Chondrinema litorale]